MSKGTYIRSLARDIGEYLGCGATLSSLCRTYASGFNLDECVNPVHLNSDNVTDYILSEEIAVLHLPFINVSEKQAIRFCNGGQLGFDHLRISEVVDGQLYRVKHNDLFIGIGFADCEKRQIGIKCIINYPKGE